MMMRTAAALVCAAIGVCVLGCSLITTPVDYVLNQFDGDTRLDYTVQDATTENPIAGAQLTFYALHTGEDPRYDESFETNADARATTDDEGKALIYAKSFPNEPNDSVVRPSTLYRVEVSAPGFEDVSTSLSPYDTAQGRIPKSVELSRAGATN